MASEMGTRLIDVDKLIDVLLHEREVVYDSEDVQARKDAKFEAVSDCIGIVNHFPEYAKKDDIPVLTVSDVMNIFAKISCPVVMKRSDTGREYRKLKNTLDDKNWWEVIGFYPRVKTDGDYRARVELVLWCRDRGSAIKDLHTEVVCDYVIDKWGCAK